MEEKSEDNPQKASTRIKELINYFDFNNQNSNSIKKTETVKNSGQKAKKFKNMSPINRKKNNKEGRNFNENKESINTNYIYYKKIIKQKLSETKENTLSFIDNIKKKMNQNYIYFSEIIYKWLKKKDKKLSKIMKKY